ncbi:MAG: 30S ribosomal protein S12 methylthiotransferase RimO, partial [Clostridia bacterium]|nr:30S ribosomal protein S12 methylthiotransferase RimO [Clostridia bacterium]
MINVNFKTKKIGLISLGCDKNRVDSEKALKLVEENSVITSDITKANIIIINSCAFLESARKEAIETVFECNVLRQAGVLEKIVLTGCLPEKFIDDIYNEFVEVDVFLGFKDYDLLFDALNLAYNGERV